MPSTTNVLDKVRILYPFSHKNCSKEHFKQISSAILKYTCFDYSKIHLKNSSETQLTYLETKIEPLNKSTTKLPEPIYIYGPCTSSTDIAFYLVQEKIFPIWSSVIVSSQSSGRGQLGKKWISPPGNLYATIRLPLCPLFSELFAPLVIGACIVQTLNAIDIPALLKWPNDILIYKDYWAKIGGILLEERNGILLAGIGINIHSAPDYKNTTSTIKAETLPICNYLHSSNKQIYDFWNILVRELFLWYSISSKNKTTWHTTAERYLAFKQQKVIIKDGTDEKQSYQGTLLGINKTNGGACLSISGEYKTFLSGSLYPYL